MQRYKEYHPNKTILLFVKKSNKIEFLFKDPIKIEVRKTIRTVEIIDNVIGKYITKIIEPKIRIAVYFLKFCLALFLASMK